MPRIHRNELGADRQGPTRLAYGEGDFVHSSCTPPFRHPFQLRDGGSNLFRLEKVGRKNIFVGSGRESRHVTPRELILGESQ